MGEPSSYLVAGRHRQASGQAGGASATLAYSLPALATPLIGRDHETAEVPRLLQRGDVRLLTLQGPGGVGKTSLAVQVADAVRDRFADGVCFVALAAIRDPDLVGATIAAALGLREAHNWPARQRLIAYLRDKHLLLLLDNFEQVSTAAPLVEDLLTHCSGLRILITSRAALGVPGEREYPVRPLALPRRGDVTAVETLAGYASVRLFLERARAAAPGFVLTAINAPTVAAICQRLDGLPLAIELAAAWIGVLSPQALLARLDNRLTILSTGRHDLPARQQTLRDAIAWSYDLLTPAEQALFRRLSVFVDGCTVTAVRWVQTRMEAPRPLADGLSIGDIDVTPMLISLRDKSLLFEEPRRQTELERVAAIAVTNAPRLHLLETIREYGLERLAASGEDAAARQAHAAYYLSLAETAEPYLKGPDQAIWLTRLEDEHDNVRAALAWARANGDAALGMRLGGALWRFWWVRGHLSEGRGWLETFLANDGDATNPETLVARVKAFTALGIMAVNQGDYRHAADACARGLTLARDVGQRECVVLLLYVLGLIAKDQGDYERAAALGEEGLALARELDASWEIILSLTNLCDVARERGDYERAAALGEEAVALARRLGDTWSIAAALDNLGHTAREQGDYHRAAAHYEESIALRRALGDKQGIAASLDYLGNVARARGQHTDAAALYEESLALRRALGDKLGIAISLDALANVARAQGDVRHAKTLAEEGLMLRRELADLWGTALSLMTLAAVAGDQGDDSRALSLYSESLELTRRLGKLQGMAYCLEGVAGITGAAGYHERAARLFGAAAALRDTTGFGLLPLDRPRYEHAVDAARAALGTDAFAAAWAQGRAMTPDQAIAEDDAESAQAGVGSTDETQYRGIFEATSDGIIITSLYAGYVVEANPAACRILGYTHGELVGLHRADIIDPDYYQFVVERIRSVEAGGSFQTQATFRRKDGTPVPIEVHGSTFTFRGKPHALGVIRDLSERVRAEERLWEKEVQYHSIFEATGDGLVIADLDGIIVEANPALCQMHGYTHDELMGAHLTTLIHPDHHLQFKELVQTVSDGGSFRAQAIGLHKSGSLLHVEVRGTAFMRRDRPHMLGVVRDVGERVLAYEMLEQRVAERTHELSTLLDLSHHMASTLELQPLLALILDQLKAVVEYSGAAILTLEAGALTVLAYRGPITPDDIVGLRFLLDETATESTVIRDRRPVLVDDVKGNTALMRAYRQAREVQERSNSSYVRCWMGVPLLLKDHALGIVTLVHQQPGYYTPRHTTLTLAIANQAAVAIENARLYAQAQELAALEERQRLARELHDSVSQALYGIALGAKTARAQLERDPTRLVEPLEYVLVLAEAALAEMRALIFELQPQALASEGLVAALEKQVSAVRARHGLVVHAALGTEPEAPFAVKEALYRIAQESLHNTIKHAHASTVELRLVTNADSLVLDVCDDGNGFDQTSAFPGHLGLHTMRERATRLGGTLDVESAPGLGARVRAQIPLTP